MQACISSVSNTTKCKSIALIRAVVEWKHYYIVNTKIVIVLFNPLIKCKLHWWMRRRRIIQAILPQYYTLPLLCWLILAGRNCDAHVIWWETDHRYLVLLRQDISVGSKSMHNFGIFSEAGMPKQSTYLNRLPLHPCKGVQKGISYSRHLDFPQDKNSVLFFFFPQYINKSLIERIISYSSHKP